MKPSVIVLASLVFAVTACSPSEAPAGGQPQEAASAAVAEPVQNSAATFPSEFVGRWDIGADRCALDESGTALTVTDRQIVGYEDTMTVESYEVLHGGSLHVLLHMQSAEYDGPVRLVMWRTSDDGEQLHIEGDSRPRAVVYNLCGN